MQWKHVSEDCSLIYFQGAITRAGTGRPLWVRGSKNNKTRTFPCSIRLQKLLVSIKSENAAPEALVFSSPEGKAIIYDNFCKRAWKKKDSRLTLEQIAVAGHFSADKAKSKKLAGYEIPGLIFSYCDLSGKPYLRTDGKPFYRIKPNWGDRKTEDSPKYLSSKEEGCRLYFSCLYPDRQKAAKSTKIDIWETEGEKKGIVAASTV